MIKIPDFAKQCMRSAVEESMRVVRHYQFGMVGTVETKADGTVVTSADKASEEAGKNILRLIPGVRVHGEESGAEGSGDFTVYLDALDGSMPYAIGASTSTVIVALVENESGQVVYCAVGVPMSGRIWVAERDEVCHSKATIYDWSIPGVNGNNLAWKKVQTYQGTFDHKSRVLIDSYPGFTKDGRTILTTTQLDRLHSLIQAKAGILALGSNGMHHAIVANGGKGAVGAITTAIGGPWDVCPVLLVLSAGGSARAFAVKDGELTEKNPLQVATYDILITGNNQETVNDLTAILRYSTYSK